DGSYIARHCIVRNGIVYVLIARQPCTNRLCTIYWCQRINRYIVTVAGAERVGAARGASAMTNDTATKREGGTSQLNDMLCFTVYSTAHAFNRTYKPLLDALAL